MEAAVAVRGLGEVVSSLPRGLDTVVGRRYSLPEDEAIELSGGQKQIVTIARTVYRRARVYVFDEPTSAVDAEKEESFFAALPKTLEGKTLLFVSHRFSTLRRAKRILVIDAGRLIEDGSHEELLVKQGRYAELFTLQAKMYQ
jgi:ATP-binding cassette subfamily B protein